MKSNCLLGPLLLIEPVKLSGVENSVLKIKTHCLLMRQQGNVVDFLRELPEVALQELFDYYYCNGDSYSTTTSTSTATNL